MNFTDSLAVSADSVVSALQSDGLVAEFFKEELQSLSRSSSNDSISISTGATAWKKSRTSFAPRSLRDSLGRSSSDSIPLDGVQRFSLNELCQFIAEHQSLKTAGIVSSSCYSVPSAVFFIPHRFLILQLHREGKRDVWLRLDRLRSPDVGLVALALSLGTTPSNDRAILASSSEKLLTPNAVEETQLTFGSPYPLSTFRSKLLDIIIVMKHYKLTSENCWAFCSLLQSELAQGREVRVQLGRVRHGNLARKAKRRLSQMEQVEQSDQTNPAHPFSIGDSSVTPISNGPAGSLLSFQTRVSLLDTWGYIDPAQSRGFFSFESTL